MFVFILHVDHVNKTQKCSWASSVGHTYLNTEQLGVFSFQFQCFSKPPLDPQLKKLCDV